MSSTPISRQHTDGRIARGQRTRDAIVAAHTSLLRDGALKPTGKEIAERAGVSVRTLWSNYKDLEALLEETTAFWMHEDEARTEAIDPSLPLDSRIEQFCQQRRVRLEFIAPAARSAVLGEPFSAALSKSRSWHVRRLREQVAEVFERELDRSGAHREAVLDGVVLASSWPSWSGLRDDDGASIERAANAMRHTLTALLT